MNFGWHVIHKSTKIVCLENLYKDSIILLNTEQHKILINCPSRIKFDEQLLEGY